MKSIVSYPDRGPWGKNTYRGNTSGYLIKDLLELYKPSFFVEIFGGGGTGFDVAQELGISSVHLDLNPDFGELYQGPGKPYSGKIGGFNVMRDEIPVGDFVFSHPPYYSMIQYSGKVWGERNHPDDLSIPMTYEEFLMRMDYANAKIYASLPRFGRHAMLMGVMRKNKRYYPIPKDLARFGTLEAEIIKVQNNHSSKNKKYASNFISIEHEEVLIFKKGEMWPARMTTVRHVETTIANLTGMPWRDVVRGALAEAGGKANLSTLYTLLEGSTKAKKNKHWREKVRQTLQRYPHFTPVQTGVWALKEAV